MTFEELGLPAASAAEHTTLGFGVGWCKVLHHGLVIALSVLCLHCWADV